MTYTYKKISYINGKWFVHLLVQTPNGFRNMRLYLKGASGQTLSPDYRIVTSKHQIDNRDTLFVSTVCNFRNPTHAGLHPLAVRYATQLDFDKFCVNNSLYFDWNAEVYRAFISPTPAEYSPASNSETP